MGQDCHSDRWYVVRSKPHREAALCQISRSAGLDVFYPTLPAKPVNPRAACEVPFFPSYLFVRADIDRLCESRLRFMPFSQGLVSIGGEPASLDTREIALIRRAMDDRWQRIEASHQYHRGERVIVTEGAFEGYQGIVDVHLPGKDRVRLLLEMLNRRYTAVEISQHEIALMSGENQTYGE